ncbi:hypothetical protein [Kitasatospora sp. NPDC059327]|uniref:hypothetical protein n=1 Tax=Kitasatospora sp. NPDC059327 TaxID=3346803 RepID=UPI00367A4144
MPVRKKHRVGRSAEVVPAFGEAFGEDAADAGACGGVRTGTRNSTIRDPAGAAGAADRTVLDRPCVLMDTPLVDSDELAPLPRSSGPPPARRPS